jgi:hypothetical protein
LYQSGRAKISFPSYLGNSFSMSDCLLNPLHQDISFPRYANEALLINELSVSYLYAPSSLAGMSQPLRQRRLAHTQKTN